MSKKKPRVEEHADESWLLPYSDLLTLLLALFIVMFAMSEIDNQKLQTMHEQFNAIFAGSSGIMQDAGNLPEIIPQEGGSDILPGEDGGEGPGTSHLDTEQEFDSFAAENRQLAEIKKGIEEAIEKRGYGDKVELILDRYALQISLREVMLFNSGDAEILPEVSSLLLEMAKLFNTMANQIVVVGHTDNVPIRTAKFRSNWDLSVIRAINVMTFLVERGSLRPDRFSVQGYGEYSPKFDNATAEGRAGNRRVEISIIRDFPAKSTDDND